MAIPSLCFIPRENFPAGFFPVSVRSTILSTSFIRSSPSPRIKARTFRFSQADRFSYIGGVSIRPPISYRSALLHGCPRKRILPESGRKSPVIIFNNVDFPAPFGPRRPYTQFSGMEREIFFNTVCFYKKPAAKIHGRFSSITTFSFTYSSITNCSSSFKSTTVQSFT